MGNADIQIELKRTTNGGNSLIRICAVENETFNSC